MKIQFDEKRRRIFSDIKERLASQDVYVVGGYLRDFLLSRPSKDLDFCTSVLPERIHRAFLKGLYFPKYGTVSFSLDDCYITIASFRKEGRYTDFRHPSHVEFVSRMDVDCLRRDFTVNALYADEEGNLYDPTMKGLSDLNDGLIRLIGNKKERFLEDPLRILRAVRFQLELGFSMEKETKEILLFQKELIWKLNPEKMKEEIRKCPKEKQKEMVSELNMESLF